MELHVFPNLVAQVAHDEDHFVQLDAFELVEDVTENRLAGHVEQRLGFGVGVRAQTGAKARQGNDNFHSTD